MPDIQDPDKIINTEGTVKWFDPKKGFGFIIGPSGQDIFVHYSKIEGEGFRALKDGSRALYDAHKTDKGWHATRVVRIDGPDDAAASVRKAHSRTPRR